MRKAYSSATFLLLSISTMVHAQEASLNCNGTNDLGEEVNVGISINLNRNTVLGFAGVVALITRANDSLIYFNGKDTAQLQPIVVSGIINRLTGSAIVSVYFLENTNLEATAASTTFTLVCSPTKRLL